MAAGAAPPSSGPLLDAPGQARTLRRAPPSASAPRGDRRPAARASLGEALEALSAELVERGAKSPKSLAAVFQEALRHVVELLPADRAGLLLFDDAAEPSWHQYPAGAAREPAPLSPESIRDLRRGDPVELSSGGYAIPLLREGVLVGALEIDAILDRREPARPEVRQLEILADLLACAVTQSSAESEIALTRPHLEWLTSWLASENTELRGLVERVLADDVILAGSRVMQEVLRLVSAVAPLGSPVLIQGETGTGKELLARRIHALSPRAHRPLVTVNCAALPPSLIEAELFGREKGAYTGALTRQAGRFEVADGSTLFLDEMGELPVDLQAKLLRVLEEGRFERVGSNRTLEVDVRIIAATHRDLIAAVEAGQFRSDLFYRLSVFPIRVPPLRERPEDIEPLVWLFVHQLEGEAGRSIEHISQPALARLQAHDWPGNVRELKNAVERAMILSRDRLLVPEPVEPREEPFRVDSTLGEVQKSHIRSVLERTGWRIRGRQGAAEILGLKPTTLESRMAKLGLARRTAHSDPEEARA